MCGPSPMIFSGLGKLAETSSQAWPSSAVLCPSLRLSSVLTSPGSAQGEPGAGEPPRLWGLSRTRDSVYAYLIFCEDMRHPKLTFSACAS